jgi:hypothetical protein
LSPPDIETEAMPMVERMVPRALECQLHLSKRIPGLAVARLLRCRTSSPISKPGIYVHKLSGVPSCAPGKWSESLLP